MERVSGFGASTRADAAEINWPCYLGGAGDRDDRRLGTRGNQEHIARHRNRVLGDATGGDRSKLVAQRLGAVGG